MRRAVGALLLAGGWVGFLLGLAHLLCAWRYQHEGELGYSVDFTTRGAIVCLLTLLIILSGSLLVRDIVLRR